MAGMEGGWMHLGAHEETPGVDPNRECYPAGQGVGAIHELIPAGDIVRSIVAEAELALGPPRGRSTPRDATGTSR